MAIDLATQVMHRHFRGVDQDIGQGADRPQQIQFPRDAFLRRAFGRHRVAPPGLAEPSRQNVSPAIHV